MLLADLNLRTHCLYGNNLFLFWNLTQQGFDKKRKAKAVKKMDHTKKRKTESVHNTAVNGGNNVTLCLLD